MESVEIDWNNIVSHYDCDELYERISAPKWLDLSAPDAPGVDDVAWFCRPDCHHPVSAEDFNTSITRTKPQMKLLRSNSKIILGGSHNSEHCDANLKRREESATLLQSPIKPKLSIKKFNADLENHNPNTEATPPAKKEKKAAISNKVAIKSSAEKKRESGDEKKDRRGQCEISRPGQPKLKSTLSARNLFSGKDVLNQISGFFQDLKKLATGKDSSYNKEEEIEEEKENTFVKKKEEKKKMAHVSTCLAKNCELSVRLENNEEKIKILGEARAFPPTPQRFPSPSGHHHQFRCSNASTHSKSPTLSKLLDSTKASERGVLHEVDQRRHNKELIAKNEEIEGTVGDVLWFLKPCTNLIE